MKTIFRPGYNTRCIVKVEEYPQKKYYADNSPIATMGYGVAINLNYMNDPIDNPIRYQILMSADETKGLIKALKIALKQLKHL